MTKRTSHHHNHKHHHKKGCSPGDAYFALGGPSPAPLDSAHWRGHHGLLSN